jgi:hypothetical protein
MFKHRIALALAALTVASVSPAFAETQPPPGTNVGALACTNFLGGKLRLDSEPSKGNKDPPRPAPRSTTVEVLSGLGEFMTAGDGSIKRISDWTFPVGGEVPSRHHGLVIRYFWIRMLTDRTPTRTVLVGHGANHSTTGAVPR